MKKFLLTFAVAFCLAATTFAQDISLTAFLTPTSGCELSSAEDVTIRITNTGTTVITPGTIIPLGYRINGGSPVIENFFIEGPINPGQFIDYIFATTADLSVNGTYVFDGLVQMPGDNNPGNDFYVGYVVEVGPPTVNVTGGGTFCGGSTATLTANGSASVASYEWSTGETTQSINVTKTGTYTVTAFDATDCSAEASGDVVIGDYVYNGVLDGTDPTQTGRLSRNGVVASCASPKSCPGLFTAVGSRAYDSYTITNPDPLNSACVTVGMVTSCTTDAFAVAYLNAFDPNNLCANYMGDAGTSGAGNFEVTLPAGAQMVVVVHEVDPAIGCSGYTLSVDFPHGPLAINSSPGASFCAGGKDTLTATSGATSYLWSTTQTTQSIIVTTAGTYSVTADYGNNGCSATASQDITVNTLPTVNIQGGGTFCGGLTAPLTTVTTGGVVSYLWSTTETTPNIDAVKTGVYTVTVTDGNNCSATAASNDVFIGDYLFNGTIAAGDPTQTGRLSRNAVPSTCAVPKSCPGYTTATGARAYDAYSITNPDAANPVCVTVGLITTCTTNAFVLAYSGAFNPLSLCTNYLGDAGVSSTSTGFEVTIPPAGQITVVVHEISPGNGCNSYTLTMDVPHAPLAITPSPSANICESGNVTLTATPATAYAWSTTETTQSINVTAVNTYSVTASYGNYGCSATASQTITGASVNLGPNITQCGGTVTLDAGNPGDSYIWSDGSTSQTLVVSTSGTYSVTVSDGGQCTATGSIEVYIKSVPVVNLGPDVSQCGGSVTLHAGNPGASYEWQDDSGNQTFVATSTGTYSVTVTDANTNCTASDNIDVTINPAPVVNLGFDISQCGGSVTLDAGNAGATYLWPDGSTAQTLVVSLSGFYQVTVTNGNGCSGVGSINVHINSAPIVNLGPDVNQCGGTVTLDAGNPGASYEWQDDSGNQTFVVTTSGTYSVTVTDANTNCTASDNVDVNINAGPAVSLGQDVFQCGGSVTLDAGNPGATYLWSDNSTNQNLTVSTSGIYRVTVTGNGGCTGTASVSVTIYPVPVVNLGPDITQCGGTVTLDAGNPGGGYQWSDQSDNQTLLVTTSGNYAVTVISGPGECSASDDINVNILEAPSTNLGPNITQCGGTVTLDAGTNTDFYSWSDGTSNQTITVSTSGTYSVTVTFDDNCSASSSVEIYIKSVPVVNLGPNVSQCGGSVTLDAGNPGDMYIWSTTETSQFITVNNSGSYTVTVTDVNTSCTAASSTNVSIFAVPVVNLGPDVIQCGGTVTLDAGNGFISYLWSDGTTNQTLTVSTSGYYRVTVTDDAGCSGTGSITVTINPVPVVNLGPDIIQCGGIVTLDAGNPGSTYVWTDQSTNQTLVVTSSGNYGVTVTTPQNCTAADDIDISIFALPVVSLGPNITQCGGTDTLDAGNAGSFFMWSDGSTNQTLVVSTSGTYSVTVTNDVSCSASSSVEVYIKAVPVVYLGTDVTQCGGSVTLDAGNPGDMYGWSTAETTQTITVSASGDYIVTITDPNTLCTAADTVTVTIDTIPVVNLGPDSTQCGGTITLDAGNAGATYLWSDGSTNQTLQVSVTGIYRVTVTNSNGCSATGSVSVTINAVPVVTLTEPSDVCHFTPPFTLNGGSPAGGTYYVDDSVTTVFDPANYTVGSHLIKYVYSNIYGCTDSASSTIIIHAQPVITTVAAPPICSNSDALDLDHYFNPTGGIYSGMGVSQHYFYPNLVTPGNDTITDIYTDVYGCSDTALYGIVIHAPVHVTMLPSIASYSICTGQSVTFTASGADLYQFFVNNISQGLPSATDSFVTATLQNHDVITVVGSNLCSTDTSEPIIFDVHSLPIVNAGPDTTIPLGTTIVLQGGASGTGLLIYHWTPPSGLSYVNILNPTFAGMDTTTYTLHVSDTYGCVDSDQVTINVYIPDAVELPNIITPDGDGFNDVWKLNPKLNLDGSHLIIFNRWGETVYETENYANDWGGTYKSTGKKVPDGTYYYVLKIPTENNAIYRGAINVLNSSIN